MSDSAQGMTMAETSRLFSEFEQKHKLFHRSIRGIPYWHLIRFRVYSTVVLPQCTHTGRAHPDFGHPAKKGMSSSLRGLFSRLRVKVARLWDFAFHNPMTAVARRDVIISLAPRIVPDPCGSRKIRQVVDPFVGHLKSSYATCEWQFKGTAVTKHNGKGKVFKWSCADADVSAYRKSADFALLREEALQEADRLAMEVETAFGVRAEPAMLAKSIADALSYAIAAPPVLRKWLKHLHVKCVVVAVAYSFKNFVLIKTARDMGLPTVELQHGTVYSAHLAYNLPVSDSPFSPDYFLAWGDWWIRQMHNFPARRALPTGYPFLENAASQYPSKPFSGTLRVLFISQGTIGKQLSELAVELSKILGTTYRIMFKLHPNEMRTWRTLYPELVGSAVEVVEGATRSIYFCLAEANAVVGVYSTAMIEGSVWGVKTYVFRSLPGADTMASFCSSGAAEYVDGVEELASRLRMQFASGASGTIPFDRSDYFLNHAATNVAAAIDRIAEGKEP